MRKSLDESIIELTKRMNRTIAEADGKAFLDPNGEFQREECWPFTMKEKFIETILQGYAINPIWVIQCDDIDSEIILDGKQRMTTINSFIQNEFMLTKNISPEFKDLVGKYYKDFPVLIKSKIRDYTIRINKYGPELLQDEDKLQDIYLRLNRSSMQLNDFEVRKPIYKPFYKILGEYVPKFLNSSAYLSDKKKSNRGEVETAMIKFLALSEPELPNFTSFNNLADKWQSEKLGETISSVTASTVKNADEWRARLDRCNAFMIKFDEVELFHKTKTHQVLNVIVMTRTVSMVKDKALFNRHFENLHTKIRDDVYLKDVQSVLGCKQKNSAYQRSLIDYVDKIIREEIGQPARRCFTENEKKQKLEEQKGICAWCNKHIDVKTDKYDGDHIIPWSIGGETLLNNCQILHKACHHRKTLGLTNELKLDSLINLPEFDTSITNMVTELSPAPSHILPAKIFK